MTNKNKDNRTELEQFIMARMIACFGLEKTTSGYHFGNLYFGGEELIEAVAKEVVNLCKQEFKNKMHLELEKI